MLSIPPIRDLIHLDDILVLVEKLQNQIEVTELEPLLRQLEAQLIPDNRDRIVAAAQTVGEQLIRDPKLMLPQSNEEACSQRYIYIPLLYKLGFTKEASELGQITFEYLFPHLHQTVLNKLYELFDCKDFSLIKEQILKNFSIEKCDDILRTYIRVKSTNSLWKKVESLQQLQAMDIQEFSNIIDDFVALRWNMKVQEGENRYDALLNAISLIPKNSIVRFRNQQVPQQSGFSCEPVMKFYYVIENVPVELQILGGLIENYMCAKGYADYKIGHCLNDLDLTEEEQNARLGLCIYYTEQGCALDFHKMMLKELTSAEKIRYETQYSFRIDEKPNNLGNQELCFFNEDKPIYQTVNYVFSSYLKLIDNKLSHTKLTRSS